MLTHNFSFCVKIQLGWLLDKINTREREYILQSSWYIYEYYQSIKGWIGGMQKNEPCRVSKEVLVYCAITVFGRKYKTY